jgi:tRNA pseudouridine synthase 10
MQLSERLMKSFVVCNRCLIRQTGKVISSEPVGGESKGCYICKGLWERMESITRAAKSTGNKHDFNTFLIGLTIPTSMCEREDQLRSMYKIRGRETIKTTFTRAIRQRFIELSGKYLDLLHPDIIIIIYIGDDDNGEFRLSVRSKPLTLRGVYKKNNRQIFLQCIGPIPCSRDNPCSIEDILRWKLLSETGAESVSFSWFGREDKESLVLGKGRPFYATLKNPRRRYLKHDLRFESNDIRVRIHKEPAFLPRHLPPLINKIRVVVSCGENEKIESTELKVLNKKEIICVKFLNKNANNIKLIYSMSARHLDMRRFLLTMICDGGLPVKRFIDGYEQTMPNVADLVDKHCKCDVFDILDLSVQEDSINQSEIELNCSR